MTKPKQDSHDDIETYAKEASKEIFGNTRKRDFDEDQLASGSENLIEKSDAERFPEELEEYTKGERKPKIVKKKEG